jgi:tyrosyl-tRNA synthetase
MVSIKKEIENFFDNDVKVLNNSDWLRSMTFIDLLRIYGKNFNVNKLLKLETIKTRLENQGISYTEFSYPVFQSIDFHHLFKNENVKIQVNLFLNSKDW